MTLFFRGHQLPTTPQHVMIAVKLTVTYRQTLYIDQKHFVYKIWNREENFILSFACIIPAMNILYIYIYIMFRLSWACELTKTEHLSVILPLPIAITAITIYIVFLVWLMMASWQPFIKPKFYIGDLTGVPRCLEGDPPGFNPSNRPRF